MLKSEKSILILLAILNFTHILDFMIMMPLSNFLIPHFNISARQFTFLVSAYTFSAAISSFLAALYVNDFDRKKVLLTAYTGFLLGTICCGIAPTYELLLSARIVAGLFGGVIGAQVISIVADLIPYERRGKAMGIVMTAFAIASSLGVPFALYLANGFGWHSPFLLVGFLGVLVIPFIVYIIPSMTLHLQHETTMKPLDGIKSVLNSKRELYTLLFSGLMFMGHFLIIPFINPFLEFNMGYSRKLTPLVYFFGGISSFISSYFLGRMADKYGKLKIYIICVWLSCPFVLFITHMPYMYFGFVVVVFALWFVVSTGRGVSSQAMVSNVPKLEFRGSFQSLNSCIQQIGTGLASVVAGTFVTVIPNKPIVGYAPLGIFSVGILLSTTLIAKNIFNQK